MERRTNRGITWGILGILAGVLLGVAANNYMRSDNKLTAINLPDMGIGGAAPTAMPSAVPPQETDIISSDLRVRINNALHDHASAVIVAMRSAYDGADSSDAAQTALETKTRELGTIMGTAFGTTAEDEFLTDMRDINSRFITYAEGLSAGDATANDALESLETYPQVFTSYIQQSSKQEDVDELANMLEEQRRLLIATIDTYSDNNYEQSFTRETETYEQTTEVADELARILTNIFPGRF